MASVLEYMQLSERVYDASGANKMGVPTGWEQLGWLPDDPDTGFSAGAYRNRSTNEIVIAYTGTNDGVDVGSWLGMGGFPAPQIFGAMEYYFKIKTDNPRNNRVNSI